MSETDRIDLIVDTLVKWYYKIPKFIRFIMLPFTFIFLLSIVIITGFIFIMTAVVASILNLIYNAYKNYQ